MGLALQDHQKTHQKQEVRAVIKNAAGLQLNKSHALCLLTLPYNKFSFAKHFQ